MKKTIRFFCLPSLDTFMRDIIDDLRKDYQCDMVVATPYHPEIPEEDLVRLKDLVKSSDVIWLEFANEMAMWVTHNCAKELDGKQVICRIHSYEIFTDMIRNIDWDQITHPVFVSEHVRRFCHKFHPEWNRNKRSWVLSNGVDTKKFSFIDNNLGENIGIIAAINHKKNPEEWLEIARKNPDKTVCIAGELQEPRYGLYFNEVTVRCGIKNIDLCGRIEDIPKWAREKKLGYVVQTSVFESFGYGVAECALMGLRPYVKWFPGADEVWPKDWMVQNWDFEFKIPDYKERRDIRQYVIDDYSLREQLKKVRELVDGKWIDEKPKISACIMVKNEEDNLPRCLDSIKDDVDEIIVIDTGSTDKTVEIAEKYGAKVYHEKWTDSFSDIRNKTLEKATHPWRFVIDADEVVRKGSWEKLKKAISDPISNVFAIKLWNQLSGGQSSYMLSERLFHRDSNIVYKSRVHNQPCFDGRTWVCELEMDHYGYMEDSKRRDQRTHETFKLLEKEYMEQPHSIFYAFHLSRQLQTMGKFNLARYMILHCIALMERDPTIFERRPLYANIYHNLYAMFLKNQDVYTMLPHLEWALKYQPDNPDLHFYIATVYALKNEEEKCLYHFDKHKEVIEKTEKSGIFVIEVFTLGFQNQMHFYLGTMYLRLGNEEKAKHHIMECGKITKEPIKYRGKIIYDPGKGEDSFNTGDREADKSEPEGQPALGKVGS